MAQTCFRRFLNFRNPVSDLTNSMDGFGVELESILHPITKLQKTMVFAVFFGSYMTTSVA